MSNENGNMPAMPLSGDAYSDFASYDGTNKTSYNPECQGMTKREMMAMHLMVSLIQGGAISEIGNEHWYAERACNLSDALLKELDK